MPQTYIFKPDDVGYKREFHTNQETYKTLKAVNTKTKLLLDVSSMIILHFIPN